MAKYAKDNGQYNKAINYTSVFDRLTQTSLQLLNTTRDMFKDAKGVYTYKAVSFTETGDVTFEKEYKQ